MTIQKRSLGLSSDIPSLKGKIGKVIRPSPKIPLLPSYTTHPAAHDRLSVGGFLLYNYGEVIILAEVTLVGGDATVWGLPTLLSVTLYTHATKSNKFIGLWEVESLLWSITGPVLIEKAFLSISLPRKSSHNKVLYKMHSEDRFGASSNNKKQRGK